MKAKKIIALILTICLLLGCAACGGAGGNNANNADNSNSSSNTNNADKELTPADISANAMENFAKKIKAANYVVGNPKYSITNVVSPEQVHIDFAADEGDTAVVQAFISQNGDTFQVEFRDDSLFEIEYATNKNAIEAMEFLLPNYWLQASNDNLYEYFYNDTEKPLEFTTNDETVKKTLAGLAGYGSYVLNRMEEVRMVMDAMDPTSVRFTAVVPDEGRVIYDDLDMTLYFGTAKSYAAIDEWVKNPTFPPERKDWDIYDEALLDGVFRRGYGRQGIPFPAVSSYAMMFDQQAYATYGMARITDTHWTEKDVEDYIASLKSKGFFEATGEMPERGTVSVLRKLLREEYKAYSQLYITYDNGLMLEGIRYNEVPEYEGQVAISEAVQKFGFLPLPETDVFTEWKASDYAMQRTEDWGYRFDYNFYLAFRLQYTDRTAARDYLWDYADRLIEAGFQADYHPGEDNRTCCSSNENVIFTYELAPEDAETGEVIIWFKDQKCITAEEAVALIKEHGLPETDIHGDINAKDLSKYVYEDQGIKCLYLNIYQDYDTLKEAENYLDTYVAGLIDQDYLPTDPDIFNSQRTYLYLNEAKWKYVAFDVYEKGGKGIILYEIVSFENNTSDSFMMEVLGR